METGTVENSSARQAESTKREQKTEDGSEESGTDSSSSSDAEEEEKKKKEVVIPAKKITEADLNEIGAKIVKAEIMGNDVRIALFQILFPDKQLNSQLRCSSSICRSLEHWDEHRANLAD